MVNRITDMQRTRDILVCLFDNNLSLRSAAKFTGVDRSVVKKLKERFVGSKLPWPLPQQFSDTELEAALYPHPRDRGRQVEIDFAAVHADMQLPCATIAVLHEEWLERTPMDQHLSYSRFCERYQEFKKSLQISMRRTDPYGEIEGRPGFV